MSEYKQPGWYTCSPLEEEFFCVECDCLLTDDDDNELVCNTCFEELDNA
jgi:hypothetical protein